MILLATAGMLLLLAGPFLVRFLVGAERDPVALIRVVQAIGAALLIIALLVRPDGGTRAIPDPPGAEESRR